MIARSRKRDWMSDTWAQLATLAVALVCFQVAERMHGSGFVAAFAGGLAFAFMARRIGVPPEMQVSDATGQLLELMVFAMFGSYAVIVGWRDADWRVVVFAVVALFAVRLVAVWLALIRSDLSVRNRLFIGWFGPRGIGTLVLGVLVVERGEIRAGVADHPGGGRHGDAEPGGAQPHGVAGDQVVGGGARCDPGAKPSVITLPVREPPAVTVALPGRLRRGRCPSDRARECR